MTDICRRIRLCDDDEHGSGHNGQEEHGGKASHDQHKGVRGERRSEGAGALGQPQLTCPLRFRVAGECT